MEEKNKIDNTIEKINEKNIREMSDVELMKLIKELIEYMSYDQDIRIAQYMSICMTLFPIIREKGMKLKSFVDNQTGHKVVHGRIDNENGISIISIGHYVKEKRTYSSASYGTFNFRFEVYNKETGYGKIAVSKTYSNNTKEMSYGDVYLYRKKGNNPIEYIKRYNFVTKYNNWSGSVFENVVRSSIKNYDFDRYRSYVEQKYDYCENECSVRYGTEEIYKKYWCGDIVTNDSVSFDRRYKRKISFLSEYVPDIPLLTKTSKYFDKSIGSSSYNCSSNLMQEVFNFKSDCYKEKRKVK